MRRSKPATVDAQARYNAFGAEIKRRRVEQRLTLVALAARAGLTPNYIGMVEMGKNEASVSIVMKLACGLGVEPGDLFGAEGLSAAAVAAGRRINAMDPRARDASLDLIRVTVRTIKARFEKRSKRSKRSR